jgi:hypothetical protein
MLTISYDFPVLPRHHGPFRHAYRSACDALPQTPGLVAHEFKEPRDRRAGFSLLLVWDSPSDFERFTRTWIGVWMLNGMGLAHEAFSAPIATHIGESPLRPSKTKPMSNQPPITPVPAT